MSAHAIQPRSEDPDSAAQHAAGHPSFPAARRLARGREILRAEIAALQFLCGELDECFVSVVDCIEHCTGRVICSGIGKAGIIAQKFAASLSSTGTPSHFLHPAEAMHGDLGCIQGNDVVVLFSNSGETEEVLRLVSHLTAGNRSVPTTIAITRQKESSLGSACQLVLPLGRHREACALGLAPSTTTTVMLAVSDAVALVASEVRGFDSHQFARNHPGGNLGRKLTLVRDVMRPVETCRVASQESTVRQVLVRISRPGRRTGAIMLTDDQQRLTGIFTDSDLARLLEQGRDDQLDVPIAQLMSRKFHTISPTAMLTEALQVLANYKISELPVIDDNNQPLGLVDITDVVDVRMDPPESTGEASEVRAIRATPDASVAAASAEVGVPRILSLIKYRRESR